MDFKQLVATPSRDSMNTGLTPARHATMIEVLGRPGRLTVNCSPVTNATVKRLMQTRDVGPFRVSGLKPALNSLERVFRAVKEAQPELHALLGTAGMTCCRAVRGSTTHFSNHSWGTAIDLKIGGILSPLNASRVPRGLIAVYPFFHQEGWFWAAGYNGRTDPMHFEVANETIRRWKSEGLFSG
jgi:hypothetical protein